MRVFGLGTDYEVDWTAPYPPATGFKLRLIKGDLVSPKLEGGTPRPGRALEKPNGFNVIPRDVRRDWIGFPGRPFFSVRVGRFGFYIGHKVFGVDSPAYLDYPGLSSKDVYEGSRAMTGFTARFTTKLGVT